MLYVVVCRPKWLPLFSIVQHEPMILSVGLHWIITTRVNMWSDDPKKRHATIMESRSPNASVNDMDIASANFNWVPMKMLVDYYYTKYLPCIAR